MGELRDDLAPYLGEFCYVFYAQPKTIKPRSASREMFSSSQSLAVSATGHTFNYPQGLLKSSMTRTLRLCQDLLLEPDTSYQPYRGEFLLIEVENLETLQYRIEETGHQLTKAPRDWSWRFQDFKSETHVAIFSASLSDSRAGKNTTVER